MKRDTSQPIPLNQIITALDLLYLPARKNWAVGIEKISTRQFKTLRTGVVLAFHSGDITTFQAKTNGVATFGDVLSLISASVSSRYQSIAIATPERLRLRDAQYSTLLTADERAAWRDALIESLDKLVVAPPDLPA